MPAPMPDAKGRGLSHAAKGLLCPGACRMQLRACRMLLRALSGLLGALCRLLRACRRLLKAGACRGY